MRPSDLSPFPDADYPNMDVATARPGTYAKRTYVATRGGKRPSAPCRQSFAGPDCTYGRLISLNIYTSQPGRKRALLPHSARSVEIIEPPTGSPTGMRYELSSKKVFVALRA
jgi:hypothetical protein